MTDPTTSDIALLTEHFTARFSKELGKAPLRFPPRILATLEGYSWPGNVRELENLVHRLVIMKDRTVEMDDLPAHMKMQAPQPAPTGTLTTLADVERQHIQRVLDSTGGNKTKAAEVLGIDRKTLREKLKGVE